MLLVGQAVLQPDLLANMDSFAAGEKTVNVTNFLYDWYLDDAHLITVEEVGQPTWSHIGDQVMAGVLLSLSFTVIAMPLERFMAKECSAFQQWVNQNLGFTGTDSGPVSPKLFSPTVHTAYIFLYLGRHMVGQQTAHSSSKVPRTRAFSPSMVPPCLAFKANHH